MGNSPVTGEVPSQRPVTRSFDVSLICALNTRLSKQSWGWSFETPSHNVFSWWVTLQHPTRLHNVKQKTRVPWAHLLSHAANRFFGAQFKEIRVLPKNAFVAAPLSRVRIQFYLDIPFLVKVNLLWHMCDAGLVKAMVFPLHCNHWLLMYILAIWSTWSRENDKILIHIHICYKIRVKCVIIASWRCMETCANQLTLLINCRTI